MLDAIPDATPTSDGIMSASDKAKLDGIPSGGGSALTVVDRSTDFNASVGNHYRVDTSGGNVTATLETPSSANQGQLIELKKIVGANNMIVSSSALIDGAASVTIAGGSTGAFQSLSVRSTGTTWDIV